MSNEVEQIKERLNLAEIIGEYIKLEKSGVNYKALCPFHNEKTPSFTVNMERNFWYCFGCQEGGDIFSFVQKIEGLEFREVLERLAERANIELPKFNSSHNKIERSKKQKALDILELATRIYQQQLIKYVGAKKILKYLKKRGFTKEVIKDFRLGYAPENWRFILEYLLQKKISLADILRTGLVVSKQNGDKNNVKNYYDRFRDRIMFPIIDINGKVIGYSARMAPGGNEETAKYINSPQSLIYDKSKILYGLYQARTAIRKSDYVIVVEGNADVVLSHRVGVKNVVAVSGTSLTIEQIKLLKRYTNKIMLNFDMDEAGQKATKKNIQVCLENDLEVKIILLPNKYKDVGDVVMTNPIDWKKAIKKAKPVMEYYFKTIFEEYDVDKIQDKKNIIKNLLNIIKNIASPVERAYWLKQLSLKTQTDEDLLTDLIKKVKLRKDTNISQTKKQSNFIGNQEKINGRKDNSRQLKLQLRLLALAVNFYEELKFLINKLLPGHFFTGENLLIFKQIKHKKNTKQVIKYLTPQIAELDFQRKSGDLIESDLDPIEEWKTIIQELKILIRKERLKQKEFELKQAENNNDEKKIEKIMQDIKKILDFFGK